jgi:16S rRNA processing protein RimM
VSGAPQTDAGADDSVVLGEVSGVFGFRGEVRLFLHNPKSTLLAEGFPVTVHLPGGAGTVRTRLTARSGAGKRILGRLEGVDDEAGARALIGASITAAKADLPPTGADELYVHELVGAAVFIEGARVGTLVDVMASGPVSLLEIDAGDRDPVFVPAIAEFVARLAPGEVHLHPGALDG